MKKTLIALSLVASLVAGSAMAQGRTPPPSAPAPTHSMMNMTPAERMAAMKNQAPAAPAAPAAAAGP